MKNYIKLMRPKHYIKNGVIFIPLVFSGLFLKGNNFFITFLGFCYFSLVASTIYIMNDIKDCSKDRKHKIKKNRPIASGKVSIKNAIKEMILLWVIIIVMLIIIKPPIQSIVLLAIYFILNFGYSFGLKNIPLLDIFILVSGFLIRLLFGASLLNIPVSNWLYLTVTSISFYLGLGKRRNEMDKNGVSSRTVLKYYKREFLDKSMYMCLTMTMIFYSLWAIDPVVAKQHHNLLIWTIPFVMITCMRYSMIIEGDSDGDPIEVILKDKILLLLTALIVTMFAIIFYVV